MRIAYVVPRLFTFIANEMIEVQKAGHEVVMVPLYSNRRFATDHGTFEEFKADSIIPAALFDWKTFCIALWVFFRWPIRVVSTLLPLHWAAGFNPFGHLRLMSVTPRGLATGWRLRRSGVDHIHAHFATDPATCAAIASRISGIPYSFTVHAYDIYCTSLKLRNDTLPWKLRHARKVLVVSKYATEILRRQLPASARERIQTVYVGVPLSFFCEKPPLPGNEVFRMLCVGNFIEKKGIDTLIEACSLLRSENLPFHLKIYGDGPLRELLTGQISSLALCDHIEIGAPISQQEVAAQMEACDAFVLPCRKEAKTGSMDGIPTVFMEAMATGRPVISCAISGIPEIVRHGETGLLVPPNDPTALAVAITRLATDEEFRIKLGKQARALVERQHDQAVNSRRLVSLLALTESVPLSSLTRQQA